ncbi:sterol desaturase family protein [Microvenator marinus]|uniref:Sterol desaturase family protein n=1 Tax=Microvenator marinus TaxID=2600177 RepID=A0A5B8XWS8_9DELT|nr:sterol desaturase family protein [Microvenator marinus]QED30010.1 sterol desaturase family protein [Microvenator marinus]
MNIFLAIIVAVGVAMILIELRSPARKWPEVAGWWGRALLFNGIQVAAVVAAGLYWDNWFIANRFWSLDSIGPVWGGLLAYFVLTFFYYWWHRFRHASPVLWRWLHQLHHSPQRLEIVTSFYKHPLEIFSNSILSSVVVYFVVGVGPEAAAYAMLLSALAEFFYHWNVKTPHWIGYFIQRPESHCVHHERGIHQLNYGDLPLWDMLFGTFYNPREWESECGFEPHQEGELLGMLLGKDVQAYPEGAAE